MSETGTRAGQDTDHRDSLMLTCLPAGLQQARRHEHSACRFAVNPGPSGHNRESGFSGPPSPGTPGCSCSSLTRPLVPRGPCHYQLKQKNGLIILCSGWPQLPTKPLYTGVHAAGWPHSSLIQGSRAGAKLLPQDMAESFALFFDSKLKERLSDLSPSHRRLLSGS